MKLGEAVEYLTNSDRLDFSLIARNMLLTLAEVPFDSERDRHGEEGCDQADGFEVMFVVVDAKETIAPAVLCDELRFHEPIKNTDFEFEVTVGCNELLEVLSTKG